MHRMTRQAKDAEIRAPFDGEFRFKDDLVGFEEHHGERYMRINSAGGSQLFRVTKVIGGHHREDFAGIEVTGTGTDALPTVTPPLVRVLPASYYFAVQRWRYKGYSVQVRERPRLAVGAVWNQTCIFCQNTEPYLSVILGALVGPTAPGFQGEVVDPLLPLDRRWRFEITDEAGLRAAGSGSGSEQRV